MLLISRENNHLQQWNHANEFIRINNFLQPWPSEIILSFFDGIFMGGLNIMRFKYSW